MTTKKKKKKAAGSVCLSLTLPAPLVARVDEMLADLRLQEPFRYVSKSAFISYIVGEWVALVANPHREPRPMPEARRRTRRPTFIMSNAMNPNAQLTVEDVRAIRRDDRTCQVIAAEMGVADSTVARVKSGQTWSWVA